MGYAIPALYFANPPSGCCSPYDRRSIQSLHKSQLCRQANPAPEIPNASVQGPRIMIACVAIGTFTGFIFLTVLLLVAGNVDNVISSAAGPLLQIFYDATQNNAGAICLLMYTPFLFAFKRPWTEPTSPSLVSRSSVFFSPPQASWLRAPAWPMHSPGKVHYRVQDQFGPRVLKLAQRRRITSLQVLRESAPKTRLTAERPIFDKRMCHHLWMYLSRLHQVNSLLCPVLHYPIH